MRYILLMLSAFLSVVSAARSQRVPIKWRLIENGRFGNGRPQAAITGIGPLAVTTNGTVYAPQIADGTVLVFDSSGKYRKTIGRRGEGPGEFVRPAIAGTIGA